MRLFRLLFILYAMAVATHAEGMLPLRHGWTKLQVRTDQKPIETILAGTRAEVLWTYPHSAVLVYAPDDEVEIIGSRAAALRMNEIIQLAGGIDPRVGIPPTVPRSELFTSYPEGEWGIYVVQFIGFVDLAWLQRVELLGAEVRERLDYNGYYVTAIPEMAERIRALPYVQFVDFFRPFQKPRFDADPRWNYDVGVLLYRTPGWEAVSRDLEELAEHTGEPEVDASAPAYVTVPMRVNGGNLARLYAHRLVRGVFQRRTRRLTGVFPRRAAPGAMVTISGPELNTAGEVRIGGVLVADWSHTKDGRIRARVPAIGTGSKRVEVQTQYGPATLDDGFIVDTFTDRDTMKSGDVITLGWVWGAISFPVANEVQWHSSGKQQMHWRRWEFAGSVFFDPDGFLHVVNGREVLRYDARGIEAGGGAPYLAPAVRVLYDRTRNAIALRNDGTSARYAPDGTLLGTIATSPRVLDGDLAADQCTLYVADGERIRVHDVCTARELRQLAYRASAVRVLPDGNLAVAGQERLTIVTPEGVEVFGTQTDLTARFAIGPDRNSLWIVGWSSAAIFDLATRTMRPVEFSTAGFGWPDIAIYGGWWAAQGDAAYAIDPAISSVEAGATTITIRGSGFRAGMTLLIDGIAVTNFTIVDANTIVVTGTAPRRDVRVVTPNGQGATFIVPGIAPPPPPPPPPAAANVPALSPFALAMTAMALAAAGALLLRQ